MAATKRNAGLTSAVPRDTLKNEELVRIITHFKLISILNQCLWRILLRNFGFINIF